MNIYMAMGVSGFFINIIYYKWRCQAEKKWIKGIKADDADSIGFWRVKHSLRSYNPDSYNARHGTNLTSREIRQIYSDKIDTAEKAFEYWTDMDQQRADKKLYSSHPFCFIIMICKFVKRENFFAFHRDKKREQDDLAKVAAPLHKRTTITSE